MSLLFVALTAGANAAAAQDPTPGTDLPTDARSAIPSKPRGLVALPVVSSSPQIGPGAGAVVAYVFQTDSISRRSALGAGGFYSTNNSWMLSIGGRVHFDEGNWRLLGGIGVYDFKYDFFGVGPAAGNANQSIDIKQRGNTEVLEIARRIASQFYLGPRFRYNNNLGVKLNGANDNPGLTAQALSQPNEYSVSALGAVAEYDTRNEQVNPTKGVWSRATAMFGAEWLGADVSFPYYEGFWNQYVPVKWRGDDVLAFRGYACEVGDSAPIWDMCLYGLRNDLRGYKAGQYRDRGMFAVQGEWRMPLKGRVSGALFAGVGGIGSGFWNSFDNLLPSGGPGIRYLLFESWRIKVGADYAFAKHGGAFYLRVGEAY